MQPIPLPMMRSRDCCIAWSHCPKCSLCEAQQHVSLATGILLVDDSTLDKFYAEKMELVTRHWSGKHGRVVQGINLISLLWTEGDRHIPRLLSVLRKVSGWGNEKRPMSARC